jgi:hypothetical protein
MEKGSPLTLRRLAKGKVDKIPSPRKTKKNPKSKGEKLKLESTYNKFSVRHGDKKQIPKLLSKKEEENVFSKIIHKKESKDVVGAASLKYNGLKNLE